MKDAKGDMPCCRVLLRGGQGEYEEKKSRFIATIRKCGSEEEAAAFIGEIRKKYWDARHNCYAFCIGPKGELTRCSDDGEPGGTAGRPMLEVLVRAGLRDAAVVVTRYFGGVLLGTGGLTRAYTRAVQEGLKNCVIGRMRDGFEVEIRTDYNGIGKILYLLEDMGLKPAESSYTDTVTLRLSVPRRTRKNSGSGWWRAPEGRLFFKRAVPFRILTGRKGRTKRKGPDRTGRPAEGRMSAGRRFHRGRRVGTRGERLWREKR